MPTCGSGPLAALRFVLGELRRAIRAALARHRARSGAATPGAQR
ncbi:MAG: hypothetical protein ACRDQ1_03650 [Sciscionella sp.]